MKKLLIALAAAFMMLPLFSTNANAQGIHYQGDASLGYAFGTGKLNVNRFNITTTHGVRINQYLFAGAGTGFNFYSRKFLALLVFCDKWIFVDNVYPPPPKNKGLFGEVY